MTESDEEGLYINKMIRPPRGSRFIYLLTFFSALGGFLFGYDTGVVSGAMILIRENFHLTTGWHEAIVSATVAAAGVFALVAGFFVDLFGRRPVILTASAVFTVGAIVMGAAYNKETLLVGRIVVGIGIGLTAATVPVYVAEFGPVTQRGRLVTSYVVMVTLGQLVAALVDGAFSSLQNNGWRYMLGLAALPSLLQFLGFLWMPESPRWLVSKGRYQCAAAVLSRVRGPGHDVDEELESIRQSCQESDTEQELLKTPVLIQVMKTPSVRRACLLGCSLQIFQQLCGINTVMYYSASIVQMSGITDDQEAIWLSAVIAGINFLCTFVGFYLVERVGRRRLTLCSLLGVTFSLLFLAVGFQIGAMQSPSVSVVEPGITGECVSQKSCTLCTALRACGFCFLAGTTGSRNGSCLPADASHLAATGRCSQESNLTWAYSWCPSNFAWITIVGLIIYIVFFAPGMSPMPWTINSEIYPLWARGTCNSLATSMNWIFNLFVSMSFLSFTEILSKHGTFYMYAIFAAVGLLVFYFILPETKGRSLEDMEGVFSQPWCSRMPQQSDVTKVVQYVHIRGLNRDYTEEEYESGGSE